MLKKIALASGAVALVALPAGAVNRQAAPAGNAENLQGQGNLFFLLAIAAVAIAVVALPESQPASP